LLLAEVVAGVSGTPLPQFLRERIFDPPAQRPAWRTS
jgi:CubicO group peptidase (beta-lactamase class C family)